VAGTRKHGNKPSGSIKGGEFLDRLSDYWLLEKDSYPQSYVANKSNVTIFSTVPVLLIINQDK